MKTLKTISLIVISLILIAGTSYILLKLEIVETPDFIKSIPVIGSVLENNIEPFKQQNIENLNYELNELIKKYESEIDELNLIVQDLENRLKEETKIQENLTQEITILSEEKQQLQTQLASRKATYKDMANYYSQMRTKDAADIISKLNDEDIIGILAEMDKEMAAAMLQNMDRNKAVAISKKMLITVP